MNPMKRKRDDISESTWETPTALEADKQHASIQQERPSKRTRTGEGSETNAVGSNVQNHHMTTDAPVLSGRAQKRAKVIGEIGSNDKAKGLIRTGLNGLLEHSSDDAETWVAAVYHNDLRAELIEEAARVGQYDYGRNRGAGPTDITSFLACQRSWGPERKDWPDVLFQIKVDKSRGLQKTVPFWHRNGRLVIDHDNHPMRDFPGLLPATLSSEAEGWLLEAFTRSDPRVQIRDLRGRMPKDMVVVDKTGTAGDSRQTKPLFTLRTITQRTLRFRGQAGLKARDVRGGSDVINKGLDALIPAEALKKNNTKELGRLLTSEEVKAFRKPNEGKYPQRGRAGKSVPSRSSKRKRDEEDGTGPEDVRKKTKRTRVSQNAAFLSEGSMNAEGPGVGMFTPELTRTAISTPGYQVLSTAGNLDYLPLDPTLFPQDEAAFQEWLHQESALPLAAVEDGDEWSDLLNLSPQEAYNLMNTDNDHNRGLNMNLNPNYGPVTYGQPNQPQVAPHSHHLGGVISHEWGSITPSVHGQVYQMPVAKEEHHHGYDSGGTWNHNASSGLDSGYAQSCHASVTSQVYHAPIEEEALYPEFDFSTPVGDGQVQNAATEGYFHSRDAGESPLENTALRTNGSLPTTEVREDHRALRNRSEKSNARQHWGPSVDVRSTPAAFDVQVNLNEQQTMSSSIIPSSQMAFLPGNYAAYASYDGTPVYYSNAPYYGGGSFESVGHGHEEEAGAANGNWEPI